MDIALFPTLQAYFNDRLAQADSDERAQMENFLLDERPPAEGQSLYRRHLAGPPIQAIEDWQSQHVDYLAEELRIDPAEPRRPWTFRLENDLNRLRQIKPELYLIRIERAGWPCSLTPRASPERVRAALDAGDQVYLKRFADAWNRQRDQRPQYATTALEVEDIFSAGGADWADRLRDRLGLGHYDPLRSGAEDIFVMRYTVAEVIEALDGQGHPAVPTLLDGELSQYFFPSPVPAPGCGATPYYGHTLNLTPLHSANDYRMGVELLHPRIDYQPEHFHRVGSIRAAVAMPLQRARQFHLPWLRLQYERDDFGQDLAWGRP